MHQYPFGSGSYTLKGLLIGPHQLLPGRYLRIGRIQLLLLFKGEIVLGHHDHAQPVIKAINLHTKNSRIFNGLQDFRPNGLMVFLILLY